MTHRLARGALALGTALALVTTGCSSDSKPAKADLVTKLSADSELTGVKDAVGAAKYNVFISCVSDYLLSKGKASDLTGYVKGSRKLDDVRVPADEDVTGAVTKCQNTAGIGTSSAPAS